MTVAATMQQPVRDLGDKTAHERAMIFLKERYVDASYFVYSQELYWEWTGTIWQVLHTNVLQKEINEFLISSPQLRSGVHVPLKPSNHDVEEVCKALRWINTHELPQPAWTGSGCPFADIREVIACRNGLLDIRTRKPHPHTPQFWASNASDFDYDPAAKAPVFEDFLKTIAPGDTEVRQCILEWFGLCLTYTTKYQKMLMIKGPRRSGKGTLARVLAGLLGSACAGTSIPVFAGRFGLEGLLNKQVAIFSDVRMKGVPAGARNVLLQRWLSISGEDHQSVERKNMTD